MGMKIKVNMSDEEREFCKRLQEFEKAADEHTMRMLIDSVRELDREIMGCGINTAPRTVGGDK
jgi:hypothetical protein